jgi:hypothetical protein
MSVPATVRVVSPPRASICIAFPRTLRLMRGVFVPATSPATLRRFLVTFGETPRTQSRSMRFVSQGVRKQRRTAANVEMADRVGFEPTNPVKGLRISSAVPSTARPPVRLVDQILKPPSSGKAVAIGFQTWTAVGRRMPAPALPSRGVVDGTGSQMNWAPINRSRPAFFLR